MCPARGDNPGPPQGCAGAEQPFACRISPTDQVAQGTDMGLSGAHSVRVPSGLGKRSGPHCGTHSQRPQDHRAHV